jgi:hypothetical protein
VGGNDRISTLEKDVDELKKIINGEGMEEGMKTVIAKTDQKVDQLCGKIDKVNSNMNGVAMLLVAGIIGIVFELIKR